MILLFRLDLVTSGIFDRGDMLDALDGALAMHIQCTSDMYGNECDTCIKNEDTEVQPFRRTQVSIMHFRHAYQNFYASIGT